MRISDWSSDVCSSDLPGHAGAARAPVRGWQLQRRRRARGTAGGRRFRARKMSQAAAPRAASDEKAMPTGASTGHDPRPTARKLPLNRLDNRVCLATGPASGTGNGIARVYAGTGGKGVMADLKINAAEVAAREIRDAGGAGPPVAWA